MALRPSHRFLLRSLAAMALSTSAHGMVMPAATGVKGMQMTAATGVKSRVFCYGDSLTAGTTLETTLGQIAPPESGRVQECHLIQVAFMEQGVLLRGLAPTNPHSFSK